MVQFEKQRKDLEDLCRRRFFFRQGSEIYGGVSGFFTYGPPGCAMKTNIIQQWRKHFIIEEQMMEIEDTNIMPHPVLKASGHVDRFSDFLVRDSCDEKKFFRADKLLEEVMEEKLKEKDLPAEKIKEYNVVKAQADAYSQAEIGAVFKKYDVKAPETGNALTEPEPFNLMFPTPIGPAGLIQGYLRPETAQGIFLNYKYCLEQNANKLPFGVCQVGKSFRNEIAPRQGLTRQREFTQAEIEWFVKPTAKQNAKFKGVADLKLLLFPSDRQLSGESQIEMAIGDAVAKGIVNNETLGYFIVRTYLFLMSIGIKAEHCRFRQHLPTEMAHYACDCWDAEIETCYGWLECVGIADRACFDLNAHADAAKCDLLYRETLDTPIETEVMVPTKAAGIAVMKAFGKQGRAVKEWMEKLPMEDFKALVQEVEEKKTATRIVPAPAGDKDKNTLVDKECTFLPEHVVFELKKEKQTTVTFMPGVVEPSFGIDRILFATLEHSYYSRPKDPKEGDKQTRGVLAFPPVIAPYKLVFLPVDQRIGREDCDCDSMVDVAQADVDEAETAKRLCETQLKDQGHVIGGFVIQDGKAHFKQAKREEVLAAKRPRDGATLHVLADPPASSKRHFVKAVPGAGMPTLKNPLLRGNLFLLLDIEFPEFLSPEYHSKIREALPPPLDDPIITDPFFEVCDIEDIDPVQSYNSNKANMATEGEACDEEEVVHLIEGKTPSGREQVQCSQQ